MKTYADPKPCFVPHYPKKIRKFSPNRNVCCWRNVERVFPGPGNSGCTCRDNKYMKQTLLSRSLWSNNCLVMKYNSTACIGGGGQPPVRIAAQKTLNNKKLNPWQTNWPRRLGSIPFLYGSTILDMNNLIACAVGAMRYPSVPPRLEWRGERRMRKLQEKLLIAR